MQSERLKCVADVLRTTGAKNLNEILDHPELYPEAIEALGSKALSLGLGGPVNGEEHPEPERRLYCFPFSQPRASYRLGPLISFLTIRPFRTKKLAEDYERFVKNREERRRNGLPDEQGPVTYHELWEKFRLQHNTLSNDWKEDMADYSPPPRPRASV